MASTSAINKESNIVSPKNWKASCSAMRAYRFTHTHLRGPLGRARGAQRFMKLIHSNDQHNKWL
jgi:hypothetical protein